MTTIRWTEAMSVGVPLLDRDHQILVGLLGRLEPGHSGGGESETIKDVLSTLIAYTEYHFFREEKVMEACGYPQLEAHHAEHRALASDVHDLEKRFREGDPDVSLENIRDFLTGWLNHHILLGDMHYRPYCEGKTEAEDIARAFGVMDLDDLEPNPDA